MGLLVRLPFARPKRVRTKNANRAKQFQGPVNGCDHGFPPENGLLICGIKKLKSDYDGFSGGPSRSTTVPP